MILPGKKQRIAVSILGPAPLRGQKPHGQQAVDQMIKRWQFHIQPVLADKPGLIVVPEACDRYPDHSMSECKEYYAVRGNQVRDFFCETARRNHCYIAYSAARNAEDGTYRNSTQLIDRSGNVSGIYNKNHLVPEETTEGGTLCGRNALVFKTDFGTVAMAICFDLNFHELLEKYKAQRPDLIIFSSMYHGGLMQNYWAYHCRAHFVGAIAGNECTVINPAGEKIAHSTNYFPRITATINLDCKVIHLDENWEKLQAIKNKYSIGVTIFNPGHLGSVLMTSEMTDITVHDIIKEFEVETWDEYYTRSLKHRHIPSNMEK